MTRKTIVNVTLAVWIFIWLLFLIRPYFKDNLMKEYSSLLALSLDGKHAYVTGKELYGFIKFCNASIKEPSTYKMIGLEEGALEHRRAVYYLYPNREDAHPDFLLVYNVKGFSREGYGIFRILDSEKYILKKAY